MAAPLVVYCAIAVTGYSEVQSQLCSKPMHHRILSSLTTAYIMFFDAVQAGCPSNQYTDAAGEVVCKANCPIANMVPRANKTGCECPAGYAYTAASGSQPATCEPCPANTYNTAAASGSTPTTCTQCPIVGQVSLDKKTCVCPLAYGLDAAKGTCTKCPNGQYNDQVDSACKNATACVSPLVVSADRTGCVCGAPFLTSAGACGE